MVTVFPRIIVAGRRMVTSSLRQATDRAARFAFSRFGSTVRDVNVRYNKRDSLVVCAVQVRLHSGETVDVEREGPTAEACLQIALRASTADVARAMSSSDRRVAAQR